MSVPQAAAVRTHVCRHLNQGNVLISSEFTTVVNDVVSCAFEIAGNGFERALARRRDFPRGLFELPFIEIAEILVDYHLRFMEGRERDIARKSLLEAYIHAAGPERVLVQPRRTRFVRSLRGSDPRQFAAMLFSLFVFNVLSRAIDDEVRTRVSDVKQFELYMLNVETICRSVVEDAVKSVPLVATQPDKCWIKTVAQNINSRLRHLSADMEAVDNCDRATG
jgi:hypothetical protein